MENASKALIMAGGILITILVVSLGIYFSRIVADTTSEIYSRMEQQRITEFNQQFLKYNEDNTINIQDIVTLINLAKDSNDKNLLSGEKPPTDTKNSDSYYITVCINISGDSIFDGVINEAISDGKKDIINEDYLLGHAERFSDDMINDIITKKMLASPKQYKCKVHINEITRYVSEVTIEE